MDHSKTQLELIFEALFSKLQQHEEFTDQLIQRLKSSADNGNFLSASTIEKALDSDRNNANETART